MDPAVQHANENHRHMSHLVFSWILGLRDDWKMHQVLALPGLLPNHPLPPGFFLGLETIATSMAWIEEGEHGAHQTRHSYPFEVGFCGATADLSFWGIASGDTWLARVEVPTSIYDADPAFELNPDIVFIGLLESLAHSAPVRIVSRLEIVIQVEDQPGPGWRRHYELPLRGHPNQLVATHLLQRCVSLGCRELNLYPDEAVCRHCMSRAIEPA